MHCEYRDEYLAYLLVEFCDYSGAEISTRSQSLLMNDMIEQYGLNKPEYFHLFFKYLRSKGDWYGKVTASKILAELRTFDADKDQHFMHRSLSKIESPEHRDKDRTTGGLMAVSDAIGNLKSKIGGGSKNS